MQDSTWGLNADRGRRTVDTDLSILFFGKNILVKDTATYSLSLLLRYLGQRKDRTKQNKGERKRHKTQVDNQS